MANRDRTGPNGDGPMTGRGMGNCRFQNTDVPFRGSSNDDLRPINRMSRRRRN